MNLITLHSGGRFMALNPAMTVCLVTPNFSCGVHAARNAGQPMTIFCPINETRLLGITDTGGTPMFYLKEAVAYINRLGLPLLNTISVTSLQDAPASTAASPTAQGATSLNDVLTRTRGAMWLQVVKWTLSPVDESPEKMVVSGFTGSLYIQDILKTMSRVEQIKYLQALNTIQFDTMYASDVIGSRADAAEKTMKQYVGVIEAVDETRAMKQWYELGETLGYTSPILKREFDMIVTNKVKLAQSRSPEPEDSSPLRVFELVDGAKRLRYAWSKLRAEVEKVNGVLK
ncbi:hypothetical protein B0T14DRAFT_567006 [Immersiella caudata]|uniref:Uncharacterized protein n=1 Tax=Immersiella caudata TaxID=314043 RepID=A0AA39WRH0_9PEZI|nr:hypothetical protein B0T14DRAFT_567006 [Immersiella caudata]